MIREGVPQFMASSDETKQPNQPRQADTNDLENLGMEELLDLYSKPSLTEGEIIKGRVVKITPTDIVVKNVRVLSSTRFTLNCSTLSPRANPVAAKASDSPSTWRRLSVTMFNTGL